MWLVSTFTGGSAAAATRLQYGLPVVFQILADHIDQLDLALDQLAMRDRNFDRFALMLVDNVVELALHQFAQDRAGENKTSPPKNDPKAVTQALGQHFESKVRLARLLGLVSGEVADSIVYLHRFRNAVYHAGLRHERILHALGLFYFDNACELMTNYQPRYWSYGSRDKISHRAIKYLGPTKILEHRDVVATAWIRLRHVGRSMGDTLVADLHGDLNDTIADVDRDIQFLADDGQGNGNRKQAIIDCQVIPFAFTDEGKIYADNNRCPKGNVRDYLTWMAKNYKPPVPDDPIPGWKKRAESLKSESNTHLALKKYCDFMSQTEDIRAHLLEAARQLDAHIQLQVDIARGK